MVNLNDAYEIAKYIKDAQKQTPVKVYISGDLKIEKNDIPNFSCSIDELNLSGLFGLNGTLNYINTSLSPSQKTIIYGFRFRFLLFLAIYYPSIIKDIISLILLILSFKYK